MRKGFFLLLLILIAQLNFAQNCENHVIFRGSAKSKQFTSVLLNSRGPYLSDVTQPELPATAWTCYSLGAPKCYTRGLFRFDLKSIPPSAFISSAKLYLFAKKNNLNGYTGNPMYGDDNTCVLQRVTSSWKASSVGWNNQPYVTGEGVKLLKKTNYQVKDFVVDVTDFVRIWVKNPASNSGMLLRLQHEQEMNSMVFEAGKANTAKQPRLEICYTIPEGSIEIPIVEPSKAKTSGNKPPGEKPVDITGLRSSRKGNEVLLKWKITSQPDSVLLEVERSTDGVHFHRIQADISKDPADGGYQATDGQAPASQKFFYRIRMNRRGRITYSQLLTVSIVTSPS